MWVLDSTNSKSQPSAVSKAIKATCCLVLIGLAAVSYWKGTSVSNPLPIISSGFTSQLWADVRAVEATVKGVDPAQPKMVRTVTVGNNRSAIAQHLDTRDLHLFLTFF